MEFCIRHLTTQTFFAVVCTFVLMAGSAKAEELNVKHQTLSSQQWKPVSDAALSSHRGGFLLSNGLVVDIQIEKSFLQNDVMTSQSYFATAENINLVDKNQSPLNSSLPISTFTTVIQNALDNQTLATLTNIDITIKNLEFAKLAFARDDRYNNFFEARSHQ